MTNSTIPAVGSTELIKANDNKGLEKAKPPADEHPVAGDGTVKGKLELDRVDFVRNARNRVKLFTRSRWVKRGTGHVACVQSRNQPDEWWIVVRSESNEKNILESRILTDTIYDKQYKNCIVWSEPDDFWLKFLENAGRTEILNKISHIQLEGKLRNSEAERRQTSESNRQLTADLNTLQDKNRITLDRNRELEQELSNSQAKIQDLEAKLDQTDVAQVIAVLKENVGKLENGEILRLQTEVEKLSNENKMKNQELIDIQKKLAESEKRIADLNKEKEDMSQELKNENSAIRKKLDESEKRIADMNKENAEMQEKKMAEELKSWEHLRQLLGGATEYSEGIRKQKEQSLQQQSFPRLDPIVPPAASKQQSKEEVVAEIGPDGDSAKGLCVDTQKNLKEAGAKNAINVASGSI
ncbi:serine/threonine-protein phosphatase 4 regulatory subunit 3 [Ditylenchus destructor]|nr:serine/threonine-protein phosphatase 4 regulatory subunit 3 [Ditylenchus destructor]